MWGKEVSLTNLVLMRKRFIKITGFVLASVFALYLLCLAAVSIYISSQKLKLLAQLNALLDDQIVGEVAIKDFDVSLWHYFPSIELRLIGVSISDTLLHKPMIAAQSLSTTVSIFQVFGKNKTIDDIIIRDGALHLFTDSSGYNNHYLFQPNNKPVQKEKSKDHGTVLISKISLTKLSIVIEDQPANKRISMVIDDLKATLDQLDSVVDIRMEEHISLNTGLGFNLSKGSYFENSKVSGKWVMQLNRSSKIISFDNKININDQPYDLKGYFNLSPAKRFRIEFNTKDESYSKATAIVTAAIRNKIAKIKLAKPMNINGVIDGSLLPRQEPYVNVNWETSNNEMEVPVLAFTACSFSGNFMNEVNKDSVRGDPNSRILVNHFSGNMGGILMHGENITITNLLTPDLKFDLKSSSTLEILDQNFALDDIRFLGGKVDLELRYDGPLSKDYIMLGELEGQFHIEDGSIEYVPHALQFTGCNGNIAFLKDSISIQQFSCNYKENHFNVEGSGTNVRKKLSRKAGDELAAVRLSVSSPSINLDDFDALFGKRVAKQRGNKVKANFSKTAASLDGMLSNSSFDIALKSEKIRRGNLDAGQFKTNILFHPGLWQIKDFSLNLAGGSIQTKGQLKKINDELHVANITARIDHVNIQKLFYSFDNFGQHAILSENLQGKVDLDAGISADINSRGKMIPGSTKSLINFSIKDGALVNFAPIANIKNFVLKDRDLHDIRFAELKDKLEVDGNKVYVQRMEIASTALHMFVEGVYGLKGFDTDLVIQIPFSNLGSPDKGESPKNKGVKAKMGPGVLLRAKSDENGKVKLGLTLSKKTKNKK